MSHGFDTTGESHYGGISNEKEIVYYLNSNPTNEFNIQIETNYNSSILTWEHIGGTAHTEDCVAHLVNGTRVKVSIKRHKASTGTFDWLNSSRMVPIEFKNRINEFKETYSHLTLEEYKANESIIRIEFNNIINNLLSLYNTDLLKNKLNEIYEGYCDYIIINDVIKNRLAIFPKNLIKNKLVYGNETHLELTNTRARSSRIIKIYNPDNTLFIDPKIRLRLTLNNGLSAFLGFNPRTRNSVLAFKLQQESINELIEDILSSPESIEIPY